MIELHDKIFDICGYDGFYIECGANDGIRQSNTIRLEREKNWRGLLIEASPSAYEKCVINRDNSKNIILNATLSSFENQGRVFRGDFDGSLTGSINGTKRKNNANVEVKCSCLDTFLREHEIKTVDLFSLDVEGYEVDVLKGIDFTYCFPKMILVEICENRDVIEFLKSAGYSNFINLSKYNKNDYPMWDEKTDDYLFTK